MDRRQKLMYMYIKQNMNADKISRVIFKFITSMPTFFGKLFMFFNALLAKNTGGNI